MQEIDLEAALAGLQSDNAQTRDRFYFPLLALSESDPRRLYPFWDVFVALLHAPEVSKKFAAIHLLSNLIKVDEAERFEAIFDDFYRLIAHESPVVAPHVAGASGKIIQAKPHLAERIVPLLLDVDRIARCRQPALLHAYVIQALDEGYAHIPPGWRDEILRFVQARLTSESPKARRAARQFLGHWE